MKHNPNIIKLSESDLFSMINLCLYKLINENKSNSLETFYRGYNSKYGSQKNHLLWITDDISYARAYGNRVEELTIDTDKLNIASLYTIDDIVGYEFDYYDGLDVEDTLKVLSNGYNSYAFYANNDNSYCICLLNQSPIANRRELSKQEFDNIEKYEGFDYKNYFDSYDK